LGLTGLEGGLSWEKTQSRIGNEGRDRASWGQEKQKGSKRKRGKKDLTVEQKFFKGGELLSKIWKKNKLFQIKRKG